MKRLLILLAATSLSTPAVAQHAGHPPGHTMPMPKAKPKPVAKPAPRKAPARAKPAARPAPAKTTPKPAAKKTASKPAANPAPSGADPHAGHAMPVSPPARPVTPAVDPHAGHDMPAAPATPVVDPHAGHDMPTQPAADPHVGHDMSSGAASDPHAGHAMPGHGPAIPDPPVAPPPPGAFSGPANAADTVFGPQDMADAREQLRSEHGDIIVSKVMIERLEVRIRDGRDGYAWDGQGWYGGDIDKLWIKSEGEGSFGESPESAEVQALWSHALDPWFNLQTGVRYDFRPNPDRAHLVLGVQGLAPYWFEVDGALFLSEKGDLTARFEAEYDQRLTQKLILQPRVEFDLAAQDVPEIGVGSGLSKAEAGLRLRYEFVPEFAPYIGVEYERAFGDTADFSRAAGEKIGGWSFLVGLRTWF